MHSSVVPLLLSEVPLLLSLPGVFVAVFIGLSGVLGNVHNPNEIVIAVVDVFFYALLFDLLVERRRRRER
jgi:hypothetical protein